MAREKGQKQRTKKPRPAGGAKGSAGKRSSVWASRLRAVAILLVVGVVAIFSGYTVGNYAIEWFFGSDDDPMSAATPGNSGNMAGGTSTGGGGAPSGGGSGVGSITPTRAGGNATGQTPNLGGSTHSGIDPASPPVGETSQPGTNNSGSSPATGTATPPSGESEVLYRVRVGAFATREEAEPDLQTLTENGFPDAYVVKSDDGTAYHIQVGAFSTRSSAFDVEDRLRTAGFAVYIESVQRR